MFDFSKLGATQRGETVTISVTELKRNFSNILKAVQDTPVAVLNHERPEAYLLSVDYYEQLLSHLEDMEDAKLIRQRANGPFIYVTLADL
jgi:antitoxin StbD